MVIFTASGPIQTNTINTNPARDIAPAIRGGKPALRLAA
jgi:hypothetical protein